MASADLKAAYRTMMDDHFPGNMEISFGTGADRQTLAYEKASWVIEGVNKGLRYGENPGQEAAMYRLVNGNLQLGDVKSIQPGRYLASEVELLQSGKHPGKTNITDVDNALNVIRYFGHTPMSVIVKHNNPCGAAIAANLFDSFHNAYMADRVAAFGGAIVVNREIDTVTAQAMAESYFEVIVAPEFGEGAMEIFAKKKNLRVMRINNIARLQEFVGSRYVDFKSLIDGGLIAQWSYLPEVRSKENLLPARAEHQGKEYAAIKQPTPAQMDDMIFGWLLESGVSSNSVLYVKDGVTVGIGTGEQDRVGVAEIARDKAYRKLADRLCWEKLKTPYNNLTNEEEKKEIDAEVIRRKGGLIGSCMISDAFFPFRDGVEVGLREGVTSVVQPGGSNRDYEVIEACNKAGVAMMFTGERSFKH